MISVVTFISVYGYSKKIELLVYERKTMYTMCLLIYCKKDKIIIIIKKKFEFLPGKPDYK